MSDVAQSKQDWFENFLTLPHFKEINQMFATYRERKDPASMTALAITAIIAAGAPMDEVFAIEPLLQGCFERYASNPS